MCEVWLSSSFGIVVCFAIIGQSICNLVYVLCNSAVAESRKTFTGLRLIRARPARVCFGFAVSRGFSVKNQHSLSARCK